MSRFSDQHCSAGAKCFVGPECPVAGSSVGMEREEDGRGEPEHAPVPVQANEPCGMAGRL